MSEEFIGAGWSFPLRTDTTGSVALVQRVVELEQAMHLILGTAIGERPMRPEFGCGIHDYVFDPVDVTTAGLIAYEVKSALERWEPRVDIVDVLVSRDDGAPNTLYIDIWYVIRGANDPRNLVFPFYVIPTE